jgi:hypothetical protein
LLPKIVIQGSSVLNNTTLANMYMQHGADFLAVLRSSTEIVAEKGQGSFSDILANLRERGAYGIPLEGDAELKHERWVAALDKHGLPDSFCSYDLSQNLTEVQARVFSADRLEQVHLDRLATRLSTIESEFGPLSGHSTRTWFFELADKLANIDSGLESLGDIRERRRVAEDIRWMATGALLLTMSNASGAELVLPHMKKRLLQSSSHSLTTERSHAADLIDDTPFVKSPWLDHGFPTLSFAAIARLRNSDEFKAFGDELGRACDLGLELGRAKLAHPLGEYTDRIAYEIGRKRADPKLVAREKRYHELAAASHWSGYAMTPIGGMSSALAMIPSGFAFSPLVAVAFAGVGMVFTGGRLARAAKAKHEEIRDIGLQAGLGPTSVHVADLVARWRVSE